MKQFWWHGSSCTCNTSPAMRSFIFQGMCSQAMGRIQQAFSPTLLLIILHTAAPIPRSFCSLRSCEPQHKFLGGHGIPASFFHQWKQWLGSTQHVFFGFGFIGCFKGFLIFYNFLLHSEMAQADQQSLPRKLAE